MVEGARLERVYRGNSIEGSNPSLSARTSSSSQSKPPNGPADLAAGMNLAHVTRRAPSFSVASLAGSMRLATRSAGVMAKAGKAKERERARTESQKPGTRADRGMGTQTLCKASAKTKGM